MKKYLLILIMILTACDKGSPTEEPVNEDEFLVCELLVKLDLNKADANSGLIEFDIIPDIQNKGIVNAPKNKLWELATIHYHIEGHRQVQGGVMLGFEREEDLEKIRYALNDFSARTGILFIEHPSLEALKLESEDGIKIIRGFSGGSSHLGKQGGIQTVKLPSGLEQSVTQHEIGHALGLLHEFKRSDRDQYVTILWENIPERIHRQFELDPTALDCGEFDLESIMMYGSFEVKKDTTSPEMTLLNGGTFERSLTLSEGDIKTIQTLYKSEFEKR